MVERLLDDRNPNVRYQAIEWAAGSKSETIATRLIDRLIRGDRFCRYALEDSLARLGKLAAVPLKARLQEGIEDEQALVAMLEVGAEIAGPGCEEIAFSLSSHASPRVRELCAELFVRLGGDEAARRLVRLLDDDAPGVRAAATRSLGQLEQWPTATRVADMLSDPRWPVRREAAMALAKFGPPGILLLRQEADREGPGAAVARFALDTLTNQTATALAA